MASSLDDAEIARRMVDHLRTAGVITDEQLQDAARHFDTGNLPSTALRLAGVAKDDVLRALSAACGIPAAPPPLRWAANALTLAPGVSPASWQRARAVPVGKPTGRLLIAFADPKLVSAAHAILPEHDACCCLEEDFDAALAALRDGDTILPANIAPLAATQLDAAPPPVLTGRADPTTVGRWKIDKLLAQGGMGVVYLAHDDAGTRAALKLVHGHLLGVAEVRARFLREARAMQRLSHQNIVRVLEVGEAAGAGNTGVSMSAAGAGGGAVSATFLATEYVDRGALLDLLEEHKRLPAAVALDIFVQMLEGLVVAHDNAIVHRDLKPANILLSSDGIVKIADFGIARELDATAMTQTGSTLGTPAYMSPEQAQAQKLDARSDLYTAGVIVYELLTGKNPFDGESLGAIVAKIMRGTVIPLFEIDATIPDAVEELVAAMMHLDIDRRPGSARDALARARPLLARLTGARAPPLARVLADARQANALRAEQASALVDEGKALLHKGVAHREAAALSLYRARLLAPDNAEAQRLLDGLAQSDGISFGPARNQKIFDVERALAATPNDPVLLQRLAQLWRQDGNVYKSATYFRRYLRVRPDDMYAAQQLARLAPQQQEATAARGDHTTLMITPPGQLSAPPLRGAQQPGPGLTGDTPGPGLTGGTPGPGLTGDTPGPGLTGDTPGPAPAALTYGSHAIAQQQQQQQQQQQAGRESTVARIAGHLQTGGFAAGTPVNDVNIHKATFLPPVDETPPMKEQLRASFSVHKGKLIGIAVLALLVFGLVRGTRSCIDGAQNQIEKSRHGVTAKKPVDRSAADASEQDIRIAREALGTGSYSDAEARATAAIDRGVKDDETFANAYLIRGRARLALNKPLAAVEDLTRVIDDYKNVDNAYPHALLSRGIAHARAGDPARARADLSAVVEANASTTPVVAEAKLERGLIAKAAGDNAGARKDLEWARDYLPPSSSVGQRAREALESLAP